MVAHGATTIWEGWSIASTTVSDCGGAESMIMWATIDRFFIGDLAGIQGPDYYGPGGMAPGFKHITIAPFIPAALDHARASVQTVRGMIASAWQRTDDALTLDVTIPGNCTATIRLPKLGLKNVSITEGDSTVWKNGAPAGAVDGISSAAETDDNVTFEVGSGSYCFALCGTRDTQCQN
jgi:alpha-L-rhamnosidase